MILHLNVVRIPGRSLGDRRFPCWIGSAGAHRALAGEERINVQCQHFVAARQQRDRAVDVARAARQGFTSKRRKMASNGSCCARKSVLMLRRYARLAPGQMLGAANELVTFSYTGPKCETWEFAQCADITCAGNKISSWKFDNVVTDTGKDFALFPASGELVKPLSVNPSTSGSTPVDKLTFSYRMRGQPNAAGILAMQKTKARTCTYIWHDVDGALTCQGGKPVAIAKLKGSAFPTHRVWINDKLSNELPQGPFDNLWKCDPADPVYVR
jgi:hypothetical protein